MTQLNNFLRQLRADRDESLRHAAKEIGISAMYLSQLECGKAVNPSANVLERIATHYGSGVQQLDEVLTTSCNHDLSKTKAEAARKILTMDDDNFKKFLTMVKEKGIL